MYHAVLVKHGSRWLCDAGDWDRIVAGLLYKQTLAKKENKKLVHLDNDNPETIERVLDAHNSLERF